MPLAAISLVNLQPKFAASQTEGPVTIKEGKFTRFQLRNNDGTLRFQTDGNPVMGPPTMAFSPEDITKISKRLSEMQFNNVDTIKMPGDPWWGTIVDYFFKK